MTNIDRAELIIDQAMGEVSMGYPDKPMEIAQALADAGWLAPDLIEPEGSRVLSWGTIAEWHPDCGLGWNDDGRVFDTTPDELRHEAACLLSAARYAEEHDNGNG